jgi:Ca2+-transporting ATPase
VAVDESVVTGESLPIDKSRGDDLLSGTLLVRGKGHLHVESTGAASTAGSLASMIAAIEAEQTPLEKRLAAFGAQIARWVLVLAGGLVLAGTIVEGWSRLGHVLLFAVALAVAAVPEGLPAVLTLTLALGVERMAKKKAVVRRLSAVEALGSVTVIATDKTGTLTENRVHVKDIDTGDSERALRAMALANDAEHDAGDPLEMALLEYLRAQEQSIVDIRNNHGRHSVVPFDSKNKFMRVTVREHDELMSYLKGAPEVLLERSRLSPEERESWQEKATGYAIEGFRVIALAFRVGEGDADLEFLGLVLLWDPPRPEVPRAIRDALSAGIRVVMVTGDHPATALAVANEVGIPPGRVLTGVDLETLSEPELLHAVKEANVFARVTPRDKLRLVEALKESGEIVAVTGDGVNDGPALKRSDVGVAMGQRGSDVSREVADLVLLDDNFTTIVSAIKEGRNIYENIQKFIRFLFAANFALTLIVVCGALGSFVSGLRDATGGLLLPLTAIQLLWINVITNGPAALALALDRNFGLMMHRPRDPRSPLLDAASLRFILWAGATSAFIGGLLLVLLPRFNYGIQESRTLLFLYATISQLVLVYAARRVTTSPRANVALHGVVFLCISLQLLSVAIPAMRRVLGLAFVEPFDLGWVVFGVVISWAFAAAHARFTEWKSAHKVSPHALLNRV